METKEIVLKFNTCCHSCDYPLKKGETVLQDENGNVYCYEGECIEDYDYPYLSYEEMDF